MTPGSSHDGISLKRHAIHAVGWSFFEKWTSRVSSLVVFAVLGHLIPISAFGLVALASVVIDFFLLFADQGVPRAVVVEREPTPVFLNTAFWISTLSGVLLFLLTLAIAPLLASMFNQPQLTTIIRVLGLSFVLYGMSNVQQAILQRELKFRAVAIRRVVAALLGGVVGVIAAAFGAGAWSLVLQTLVAYTAGGIVIWMYSSFRPGRSVGKSEARSIWAFGANVIGIDTLSWVSRNGDNLVVGAALGPKALGIYSVSYKILSIVTELVIGVVANSSLPLFAKVSHDMQLMAHSLMQATRATAMLSAPIFALLAVEASSIIPLVYGDKWGPAVPIVQIFCIVGLLNAVTSMDRSVLLAAKRQRLELGITAGGAVLNVIGFLIGVHWGYQGVAVALVVRGYLYWPVRLWALRLVTGMRITTYVKQWLVPVAAAITLVVCAYATRMALDGWSDIPLMIISGTVGFAAYIVMIAILDGDLKRSVTGIISRKLRTAASTPTTTG